MPRSKSLKTRNSNKNSDLGSKLKQKTTEEIKISPPLSQDSNPGLGDFSNLDKDKHIKTNFFTKLFKRIKVGKTKLITQNPHSDINNLNHNNEVDIKDVIFEIDKKLEKSASNFQHLIYLVVILVIFMQVSIFWIVQKPQFNFFDLNNNAVVENTGIDQEVLSKEFELKNISDFSSNPAIVDLGFNLDVKPKSITAKKSTLCQTQVVPSPESGCGFSILNSALGLSDSGIILRSIRFNAELGPEDKIDISIKNFEKGIVSDSIATLKEADLKNKTPLPSFLSPVESIYVRLWQVKGQPKINQISIEYSSVNKLKSVSGEIDTLKVANQKGFVYSDEDENELLSKSIDLEWKCQIGFPGVKTVDINQESKFEILRDDECYTAQKSPNWENDNQKHSLPAGKWLLVVNDKVYPFEIKTEDTDLKLTLIDK